MNWFRCLHRCIWVIGFLLISVSVQAAQTIYLIRHAEKSKQPPDNPALTEQGYHRAGHMADMLAAANIRTVYSSPYQRTRQTAAPIAERHQLNITEYDPRQLQLLADTLKSAGDNAVVVGHSNTTPRLLNLLTGLAYPDMDESEYDTIFQLTLLNEDVWQLQTLKSLPRQSSTRPAVTDLINYVMISPSLHTAGMPTPEHLRHWGTYPWDAVVNLAPHEPERSVAGEAEAIQAAGGRYLNIAVDWQNPTNEDFDRFMAFMRHHASDRVLVHCRKNMRASVFAFLYRVIHLKEDVSSAYTSVLTVWEPNPTWKAFAQAQLQRFDIDGQIP